MALFSHPENEGEYDANRDEKIVRSFGYEFSEKFFRQSLDYVKEFEIIYPEEFPSNEIEESIASSLFGIKSVVGKIGANIIHINYNECDVADNFLTGVPIAYFISEDQFQYYAPEYRIEVAQWISAVKRSPLVAKSQTIVLSCLGDEFLLFTELDKGEYFIAYALGILLAEIPHKKINCGLQLQKSVSLPEIVKQIGKRQGGKYGLRITSASSISDKKDEEIIEKNIGKIYQHVYIADKSAKCEEMFSLILKAFRSAVIVCVHEVPVNTPDIFFKWCAEHTRKNPWRYIWFYDISITYLFSEMIDRFVISQTAALEFQDDKQSSETPLRKVHFNQLPLYVNDSTQPETRKEIEKIVSIYKRDWKEHNLKEILKQSRHILIVGPPGIGKTTFLNHTRGMMQRKSKWVYVEFDGSSEELFKQSVQDLLLRKIGYQVLPDRKYMIVVDEYHLMTMEQQKQALLFFTANRLHRLVLISNRYDSADEDLLRQYFDKAELLSCSLGSREVTEYFISKAANSPVESASYFIKYWIKISRNILGETMMSYRFLQNVAESFVSKDSDKLVKEAQKINQSLSIKFFSKLISIFWSMYENKEFEKYENPEEFNLFMNQGTTSLLKFLIHTCLLDSNDTCQSYPEFSVSSIKNFNVYHPAYKLYSWCHYMHARSGESQLNWFQNNSQNILQLFLVRTYVELPARFPRIDVVEYSQGTNDPSKCRIMYLPVSPPSIDKIIDIVKRGYTCDDSVKLALENNPVTDVTKFEQLCSIFTPALFWVTKENLKSLIKLGTTQFAKLVVEQFAPPFSENNDRALNPYFIAAWKLYKSEAIYSEERMRSENSDFPYPQYITFFKDEYTELNINLKELFLWASLDGYNMADCAEECSNDLHQKLEEDLYALTRFLASKNIEKNLPTLLELYSYMFAPLLHEGAAISYETMFRIASSQHPPLAPWGEHIKHLSHVNFGTLNDRIRNGLSSHPKFWSTVISLPVYERETSPTLFL